MKKMKKKKKKAIRVIENLSTIQYPERAIKEIFIWNEKSNFRKLVG